MAIAATTQVHEMEMVISGELMSRLMSMVERVARTPCAVLITGETGVGKELIARAIHSRSLRCGKPWVDINCAALPEHLVESELFGYEKGAFSGADSPKAGLFELADQGTLFLDEIGELEPKVQVKLLRVLDGVPYYRLGGRKKIAVDVRLITATNRPLEDAVRAGQFRADLYHRLTQFELRVPPLRDRPEDILCLGEYFLRQCSNAQFRPDTLQVLTAYSWPGNVRELRNVVMKAALMAHSAEITPDDLPAEVRASNGTAAATASAPVPDNRPTDLSELERQTILSTLQRAGGHQGVASQMLGISRRTLSRKLKQYRIEGEERRAPATILGTLGQSELQHFRAEVRVPVLIRDNRGENTECVSQNVSIGGLALEHVGNPFLLTEQFHLQCQLPDGPQIECNGKIVWADASGRAGVSFLDLAPDVTEKLRAWLDALIKMEGWAARP